MSEHDYVVANDTGANVRADLNLALLAIQSQNSKSSAPSTTYAYMFWADTANDLLKQRNAANSAWINVLTLSTGSVRIKGGDIASGSPTVIDTDGNYFDVTGTTSFTAFTVASGRHFFLQFDGVLTMTHHVTNLDLPGLANITTAAGDVAEFFATGTNTVQCLNYTRATGVGIAESVTLANSVTLTNKTLTAPAVTNLTGTFNSPTGTIGAMTLGGAVTGGDQEVSAVTFKDVAVKTIVLGASGGGTLTANLSLGQHFTATIDTGSSVISVSNPVASDEYMAWVISLTNGGSQTITWTAVDWNGGAAPALTSSGLDLLGFFTYDGATTIHGFPISLGSA